MTYSTESFIGCSTSVSVYADGLTSSLLSIEVIIGCSTLLSSSLAEVSNGCSIFLSSSSELSFDGSTSSVSLIDESIGL
jgi:hypothetical protein